MSGCDCDCYDGDHASSCAIYVQSSQPPYRLCAYDPCFDGAPCGDLGSYYVNGRYSCGHHLEAMIVRYAATNTVGHRWATVQVLTVENAPEPPE